MTEPMTQSLADLSEKATQGPYFVSVLQFDRQREVGQINILGGEGTHVADIFPIGKRRGIQKATIDEHEATAAFIAASVNTIRALLATESGRKAIEEVGG